MPKIDIMEIADNIIMNNSVRTLFDILISLVFKMLDMIQNTLEFRIDNIISLVQCHIHNMW